MTPRIVVFGATGYTGGLVAQALVRRGLRPVLAARSKDKLASVAERLGGLDSRVANVSDPASIHALVARGDVLLSTVGPFERWGRPALDAAIDKGAHYLDSTGESGFLRQIFSRHDDARVAGIGLLPAFGYDYVPGNLAGALALERAGERATQLDVAYLASGSVIRGLSSGTIATMAAGMLEPTHVLRDAQIAADRGGARVRRFSVGGRRRSTILAVGSEPFTLPRLAPGLRELDVYNGWFPRLSRPLQAGSAITALIQRHPAGRRALTKLVSRVQSTSAGPDEATRAATRTHVLAVARDSAGRTLAEVHVEGPNIYTLTGELLAWGAAQMAAGRLRTTGALGPVDAFGLEHLSAGCAEVGLVEIG
jgi:short subunit dehydrogenase-like uncharacterized protein